MWREAGLCSTFSRVADVSRMSRVYVCQHTRATPLHLAAMHGHEKAVLVLLEAGAKVDAEDKVRGRGCHGVAVRPLRHDA